jgi:putative redox protein
MAGNGQTAIRHPERQGEMTEARATWTAEERFFGIASSGHAMVIDAAKGTSANSPMELVLIGLCGCTASDVVNILRKKREPFTSLEVRAQAERAAGPPAVYTEIRLTYRVGGKVSRKAMEDAVRLSEEKYCSVAAMLAKTAKISLEIEYDES